jgi:VWFA-related protein
MRKLFTAFLLVSLLISISPSLLAQSRPRRVEQPVSAPPPEDDMQTADSAPSTQPRRPVLTGNISGGTSDTPSQSNREPDGPVEIGDGDTVRVETTLITIPVTVTDRDGKYIPNLSKEDFRVFENGVEQQVAYFAPVEKPFTVALVIDTSNSTQFKLAEIQDAAIAFVNQLRADDRVMVVAFADHVRVLSEPTSDRNVLVGNGGGTSLYDAIDFVINQRLSRIEGRKAIVLFTDGVDTTSRIATYQSNIHDAEELDALIYPVQYNTFNEMNAGAQQRPGSNDNAIGILIGILSGGSVNSGSGGGGRGTTRADYERADRFLGDLAERTGARRYRAENTQNLERSFAMVAEELRRQYGIGYYPQAVAQTGERRQVKVRVNRPNMIVRARDSYIGGDQTISGNRPAVRK